MKSISKRFMALLITFVTATMFFAGNYVAVKSITSFASTGYEWVLEPSIEADDILSYDIETESDFYHYNHEVTQELAYIKRDGLWGIIDYNGYYYVEPEYEKIMHYIGMNIYALSNSESSTNDFYTIKSGDDDFEIGAQYGGRGYMHENVFYEPNTDSLWFLFDGSSTAYKFSDYSKHTVTHSDHYSTDDCFIVQEVTSENYDSDGNLIINTYNDVNVGNYGIANKDGLVQSCSYEKCRDYKDDLYWSGSFADMCAMYDGEHWAYFNSNGEQVTDFIYDDSYCVYDSTYSTEYADYVDMMTVYLPTEGYVPVKSGNGYGYIDINGNEVIETGTFSNAKPFHNGLAWVQDNETGLWGVISLTELNDETSNTDTSWYKLYYSTLMSMLNANGDDTGLPYGTVTINGMECKVTNDARFNIDDIDGNGIPEFIYSEGSYGYCSGMYFTVVNNEIKFLLYGSRYGVTSYGPENHIIYNQVVGGGSSVAERYYYTYTNNDYRWIYVLISDFTDINNIIYKINGDVATKDEYDSIINEYDSMITVIRSDLYPLTTDGISDCLYNALNKYGTVETVTTTEGTTTETTTVETTIEETTTAETTTETTTAATTEEPVIVTLTTTATTTEPTEETETTTVDRNIEKVTQTEPWDDESKERKTKATTTSKTTMPEEARIALRFKDYYDAVNNYLSTLGTQAKANINKETDVKNYKELMAYDYDKNNKHPMIITAGHPTSETDSYYRAIEDAYEVLYDFLVKSLDIADDEHIIEFDVNLDDSMIEIEGDIIKKIFKAVKKSSENPEVGEGSNGFTVKLDVFGIGGVKNGSITMTKGKLTYTAGFTSNPQLVADVMNRYMNDLKEEVKTLYNDACNSMWGYFGKESTIGAILEDEVKNKIGDFTDTISKLGFGKVLKTVRTCRSCYDDYKELVETLTGDDVNKIVELLTDTDKNKSKLLYKALNNKEISNEDVTNVEVKKAVDKLEEKRKELVKLLNSYLYTGESDWKEFFDIYSFISCPVDVDIIDDETNEVVGYVHDGVAYSTVDDLSVDCINDTKIIGFASDKKYRIEYTGTDTGEMQILYKLLKFDGNDNEYIAFYDIPLEDGIFYSQTIDTGLIETDKSIYLTEEDGELILPSSYGLDGTIAIDCYTTDGGFIIGYGDYVKGDSVLLNAVADDGYRFAGWYDEDNVLVSYRGSFRFTAMEDMTLLAVFEKDLSDDGRYKWTVNDSFKDTVDCDNVKDSFGNIYLIIDYDNQTESQLKVEAVYNDGEVYTTELNVVDGYYENPIINSNGLETVNLYDNDNNEIAILLKNYNLGDVNGDGMIDASDASQILGIYATYSTGGTPEETEEQLLSADVNSDGNVDASDASTVLSYYAYVSTGGEDSFDVFIKS